MATLAAKEQCCVFCVSMLVLLLQAVAAWSSHTPHTGKCFHFDGRKTCLDLASQRSNTTDNHPFPIPFTFFRTPVHPPPGKESPKAPLCQQFIPRSLKSAAASPLPAG
ncbi:uncharacterized protein LOC135089705 isoform X2 [Scylla paramamosain]|uniref:uncharacterized protein LOC135089705 isoform X2 n=1 Tax=Scylla paramamosain TaxID=85552 RepID=UPI003082D886